jgi:hypothetical protein
LQYEEPPGQWVNSYSPPTIDPVNSLFTAAVSGADVGDEYDWGGLNSSNAGTVLSLPLSTQLTYGSEHETPFVRKTQTNQSWGATGSLDYFPRVAESQETVHLNWKFNDGLFANSTRIVNFHASKEKGLSESNWYKDFRVGPSPAETSYQVCEIINPMGSPPYEFDPMPGFVTAGYEEAQFLPISMGWSKYRGDNSGTIVEIVLAFCAAIPHPAAKILVALTKVVAGDVFPTIPPTTWAAVFHRSSYNSSGGDGKWCDFLNVRTSTVDDIRAFDNPAGLTALKNALAARGTTDLYWRVKVRMIEWNRSIEAYSYGPDGFQYQSFDLEAKPVGFPVCFKYYEFVESGFE